MEKIYFKYDNKYNKLFLFNSCKSGNKSLVKYLVEHGADVNKINKYNETPLYIAYSSGKILIINYLNEHGANINKKSAFDIIQKMHRIFSCGY